MKKQKKIITLCASVTHYRALLEIREKLAGMGYDVLIPDVARSMEKTGDFDVSVYKTWHKDPRQYFRKTKLMKDHFDKVLEGDAILVVNEEKNGMKGYIGGNVLMEMVLAFHYNKPIFLYHPISENLSIKEEVYGLQPIFLDGDITRLGSYMQDKNL